MKGARITSYLSRCLITWLLVVASPASAQTVLSYSSDANVRVLSYSETPQMLGNPDRTPRIQVFGDGWVWVHYPRYMKKAGDYEAYLSPGELRKLLQACAGVFDFNPKAVVREKEAVEEARKQSDGVVYYRSENTLEQIEVRVDSYQASPQAVARGINLKLSWNNIAADARDYPEVAQLQRLKGVRNSIRALLERDDLVSMDVRSDFE